MHVLTYALVSFPMSCVSLEPFLRSTVRVYLPNLQTTRLLRNNPDLRTAVHATGTYFKYIEECGVHGTGLGLPTVYCLYIYSCIYLLV